MKRLRFAVIGCGRMGRHHSQQLRQDGRAEVVALTDLNDETAHSLQLEFWPSARVCRDVAELISLDEIDAAILCTPTIEHYEQSLQCLDRGWHILCEKPLASNREQIIDLIAKSEVARDNGQVFSLGYQRRHTALYRTLRKEVTSGRWGFVRAIVSHNVENWQQTISGTWRDDPAQNPGGFLTDAGSHKLDSIFYLTGLRPVEVFARSQTWGSHVEIITSASALLTEDVTATIDFVGNAQYLGEDLCIHCEKADWMIRHGSLWLAQNGSMEKQTLDEPESTPVRSFLDSIILGAAEISPPSSALPVFDLTQAILKSGREHAVVRIPQ